MPPLFSSKEIEEICLAGENAARECVLSVLDRHLIRSLNVRVTSQQSDSNLDFDADVEIQVVPIVDINLDSLAEAAANRALEIIDEKVRAKRFA